MLTYGENKRRERYYKKKKKEQQIVKKRLPVNLIFQSLSPQAKTKKKNLRERGQIAYRRATISSPF
jgi:hypothetical protein